MLVTALTPIIGYDKAAKYSKNGTQKWNYIKTEVIKSGL